jgi:hypothetical protein
MRSPENSQRRRAVQEAQVAEANRKANAAIASRQAVDRRNAERDRQYQTRSWCEWHNERRRREALAKGSQSYQREDCSRYPSRSRMLHRVEPRAWLIAKSLIKKSDSRSFSESSGAR